MSAPAGIEVVPMREGLIESFHACVDAISRERVYLSSLTAPALPATRMFVRLIIENGATQLVALDGARVVGFCDVVPKRIEGYTHMAVLGIGLLREYRGAGLGTRLLREALERARARGVERVELEVYASNAVARRLYEREGFVTEGIKRRARKLDGVYDDVVIMARLYE